MPGRVQEELRPLSRHHTWPFVTGEPAGTPRGVLADHGGLEGSYQSGDCGLHGHSAASGDVFGCYSCQWRVLLPSRGGGLGRGKRHLTVRPQSPAKTELAVAEQPWLGGVGV